MHGRLGPPVEAELPDGGVSAVTVVTTLRAARRLFTRDHRLVALAATGDEGA